MCRALLRLLLPGRTPVRPGRLGDTGRQRRDRKVVAPDQRLALLLRVVLAQRIADELLVEVDPPEIGMAVEPDPVHVERLALLPVERRPQLGERGAARIV